MDKPTYYEIRVTRQLESRWADWFGGMTIYNLENGDTLLAGFLPDQAALQGVLKRIGDLGLSLVSVNALDEGEWKGLGDKE